MSTRDLTFFVDLDGTLKTEAGAVPPFQVGIVEVESGMNKYDIGIRPHIHDFLKCAKSKGRVVLSTASFLLKYLAEALNIIPIVFLLTMMESLES
jgi:hypothetical protein